MTKDKNKFVITGTRPRQTVEADWYVQEGDFFVFYYGGSTRRDVVATIVAAGVHAIRTESEASASE